MGSGDESIRDEDVRSVTADAVVWGLPLLLMDLVRRAHPETGRFFAVPAGAGLLAPGLAATHPDIRLSSAVVDLAEGPVALNLPDARGAYMSVQVHDGWGRILATFGSHEAGRPERQAILLGPTWSARALRRLPAIVSATDQVWIVCRILGAGEGGREDALRLQRQVILAPGAPSLDAAGDLESLDLTAHRSFAQALEVMTPVSLMRRLSGLLPPSPAGQEDRAMRSALARLGVTGERPFEVRDWATGRVRALDEGVAEGLRRVRRAAMGQAERQTFGWTVVAGGTTRRLPVLRRAAQALTVLGAPPPQDVLAWTAFADAAGHALDGSHDYGLMFGALGARPARAFWSVSLTDLTGLPLELPFSRLSFGDWFGVGADPLEGGQLYVGPGRGASTLAPPHGGFGLRVELYAPDERVLVGDWTAPDIIDLGPRGANDPRPGEDPEPDGRGPRPRGRRRLAFRDRTWRAQALAALRASRTTSAGFP